MPERKPGKTRGKRTPGAKNRMGLLQMLKLVDQDTGEFIANVRWRSHGHLYVEHAKHVKPRVVEDTPP